MIEIFTDVLYEKAIPRTGLVLLGMLLCWILMGAPTKRSRGFSHDT